MTAADIVKDQIAATNNATPTLFSLQAQMLDQGRTDSVLAATDDLSVRLKVYASGGENGLHAHVEEDHVFIILQGSARFFGPDEEAVDLSANQGIMMPKGMLYRFFATSEDECLVMLRIGTPNFQKQPKQDRVDADGNPMGGDSEANKTVPVKLKEGVFFGR